MEFLNNLLERPNSETTIIIIAVGRANPDAKVPKVAKIKKPLNKIMTTF